VPHSWRSAGEGTAIWADLYSPGSVHSDFGISRFDTGGAIAAHVHSFEETFYAMDGEVLAATPEATVRLTAADYGVIPVS
jgi:hypothetical protein